MKSIGHTFLFILAAAISAWAGIASAAPSENGAISSGGSSDITQRLLSPPANILKGNVSVGGQFGIGYSTYSQTVLFLDPTVEYFAADKFSVGGTLSASLGSGYQALRIGPSATYYFWDHVNWATSVGAGVSYGRTFGNYSSEEGTWTGTFKLGASYFFTPSVSFGPQLTYFKEIGGRASSTADSAQLLFNFNVHL